jgi:hypothetical protein
MNGPFAVAQANTGGASATPVQVLKLIKPKAGETGHAHVALRPKRHLPCLKMAARSTPRIFIWSNAVRPGNNKTRLKFRAGFFMIAVHRPVLNWIRMASVCR